MSDKFSIIPLNKLLSWILGEYKSRNQIFGIHRDRFFIPSENDRFTLKKFSQHLETPVGVAAGPHTQMAQNIITAWLVGARFIELKTVQTMDELKISRPCIDMEDEGYNCEWSQELKLDESFDEYLKAFIVIHILKDKLGIKNGENAPGFIFNLSVGYNMEGILKKNIQEFFENCRDISKRKKQFISEVKSIYPAVDKLATPDVISDNITLSTMHGCPPEEVEKIGLYLIEKLNLHTTIKLNPTLLGYERVKDILHNKLGFNNIKLDAESFVHDLQLDTAVKIVKRLKEASEKRDLSFGVKLTNTLACINSKNVFTKAEKMMYMSGRALHPLGINLAKEIYGIFEGGINASFAGGADVFSVSELAACNLLPVTVCSDILKPGGYARIRQYLENLDADMAEAGANSIKDFILKKAGAVGEKYSDKDLNKAVLKNIGKYAGDVLSSGRYGKEKHPYDLIKMSDRPLKYFDCIKPPCVNTCPDNQDVPDYMYLAAKNQNDKALEVIERDNPLPHTCGTICTHLCETKCTRINYDDPLMIRDMKLYMASSGKYSPKIKGKSNGIKVAVIGAGPAGLSAAYFLVLANFDVTIFESGGSAGGTVSNIIPSFRLSSETAAKDADAILKLGVKIKYNQKFGSDVSIDKLKREGFKNIFIATGLQQGKGLGVDGENADGVIECLKFLADVKRIGEKNYKLGGDVAVFGGGNSAIDSARTALRVIPTGGKVFIVYRRTKSLMPAWAEEIRELSKEGIEIIELTAQKRVVVENGKVSGIECVKMKLGDADASGRARPVEIKGSEHIIPCRNIIVAIGQESVAGALRAAGVELNKKGLITVSPETGETNIENVYAGGDIVRGAATIIHAIADGKRAAAAIISKSGLKPSVFEKIKKDFSVEEYINKRTVRRERIAKKLDGRTAPSEADRCLFCDELCNICVTVCPNRANQYYTAAAAKYSLKKIVSRDSKTEIAEDRIFETKQNVQTLNVGDFCNECGNCTTFCPTNGSPYKDKPKIYLTKSEFDSEEKNVFYFECVNGETLLKYKLHGHVHSLKRDEKDKNLLRYENDEITAAISAGDFGIKEYKLKIPLKSGEEITFETAAGMSVLLEYALKDLSFIFCQGLLNG